MNSKSSPGGESIQFYSHAVYALLVAALLSLSLTGCGLTSGSNGNNTGPGALTITTSSLSGAKLQASYSASLSASGGKQPYAWSISSGSLPAGLSLAPSTGKISGTPTQSGNFVFTAKAVDSSSSPQSATHSLTINVSSGSNPPPPSTLIITTNTLPAAQVSVTYSATLAASNGQAPYTWGIAPNSDPLPPGLTLAATTGTISGTPSASSAYTFTVQVGDSSSPQQTATKTLTMTTFGVALDQYGGRTDVKCANATGWFHAEKISNRWRLCTPAGNAFFMQGVEQVVPNIDTTYQNIVGTKYGGALGWAVATNQRLLSWGFNTLATGEYFESMPSDIENAYPLDVNGLHSQPVKIPFTVSLRPAFYSMSNPLVGTGTNTTRLLTDPVKNMLYVHSSYYSGYIAPGGTADYFDTNINAWLAGDLSVNSLLSSLQGSPYFNYLIGITVDDGDEMNGFSAGPDFATLPPGSNNYNLSMMVAAMSPVQVANSQLGWVYSNTAMQTKVALQSFLTSKYGTVAALNTAWGSNYTTFGSSGTTITGESVGTGNGSTLTFTHTLAKLTPSRFSVQILVAGTPVAGGIGNGTLYGPNVSSGTINYTTGAVSITFTSGHAPASGAAITVNYVQNGWEIGTGFMDEDDRPSHQPWMGNDWVFMSNANPNLKADMNAFLGQMAAFYFKTCHDDLKAALPNILYLGPDSLGTHGVPPPASVLQAAGQYMDAFLVTGTTPFTQAEMDYIEQNAGDKPYIGGFYTYANPDSALNVYPNGNSVNGFTTQSARGQAYVSLTNAMIQTAQTSSGNFPYIGNIYWELIDNWSEKLNWGMVTHLDNAYDGHEDVTASVPCSPPFQQFTCGGEAANYGDLITNVRAGNLIWLLH